MDVRKSSIGFKKHLTLVIIFSLFVGFSSCASKRNYRTEKAYSGPERDKSELAIIVGDITPEDFTILGQVDSLSTTLKYTYTNRCEILPGKHTVEIAHGGYFTNFNVDIYLVTFEAKAEKTYSIKAFTNQEKKEVAIQVIDADSGERVPSTSAHKYTLRENHQPKNRNVSWKSINNNYTTKRGYTGPKQKKSSLARVKENDDAHLYFIDSIFVGDRSYKNVVFEILPGSHTHTIAVTHPIGKDFFNSSRRHNSSIFIGFYKVTFDAEIGKNYSIEAETDLESSMVYIYVTEATSGERVPSTVDYCYHLKENE